MNLGIELHDSTITRIIRSGTTVRIALEAIVHEAWGSPGVDAGEVWLQSVDIVLTGVASSSSRLVDEQSSAGQRISDGSLRIGDRLEENVIPLPVNHTDSSELMLILTNGATLLLKGNTIRVDLSGSREYLEPFPGASL